MKIKKFKSHISKKIPILSFQFISHKLAIKTGYIFRNPHNFFYFPQKKRKILIFEKVSFILKVFLHIDFSSQI